MAGCGWYSAKKEVIRSELSTRIRSLLSRRSMKFMKHEGVFTKFHDFTFLSSGNIMFFPAAKHAGLWIIIGPVCDDHLREAFTGQRSMGIWVIEVTEFKFEVSLDLRIHLEAAMASGDALEAKCT